MDGSFSGLGFFGVSVQLVFVRLAVHNVCTRVFSVSSNWELHEVSHHIIAVVMEGPRRCR